MGNRASAPTTAKKGVRGGPSAAQQLLMNQQAQSGVTDDALEEELRAAQETALQLTAGVDILEAEIRLEAQLAALDDDFVDDDAVGGGDEGTGDDDDAGLEGLDADELAALEDELQELEREVLGVVDDALQLEAEEEAVTAAEAEEGEAVAAAERATMAAEAQAQAEGRGGARWGEDDEEEEEAEAGPAQPLAVAAAPVAAAVAAAAAPATVAAAAAEAAAAVDERGAGSGEEQSRQQQQGFGGALPVAASGLDALLELEDAVTAEAGEYDDYDGPPAGLLMG